MAARQQTPQPGTVDPNVPQDQPRPEGDITTLEGDKGLFAGEATVVDEVVESPLAATMGDEPEGGWWVIRPGEDIEHMNVGIIDNSYSFKAGTRYKVPYDVMSILAERDYLSERPFPANA